MGFILIFFYSIYSQGYDQSALVSIFTLLIGKGFNGIVRAIIEKLLNPNMEKPQKSKFTKIQYIGLSLFLAYFVFTLYFLYSFALHCNPLEKRAWLINTLSVIFYDFIFKLFGIVVLGPALIMINKDFAETLWFKFTTFIVKAAFFPFEALFSAFVISSQIPNLFYNLDYILY